LCAGRAEADTNDGGHGEWREVGDGRVD
jgi:hypothetical protein